MKVIGMGVLLFFKEVNSYQPEPAAGVIFPSAPQTCSAFGTEGQLSDLKEVPSALIEDDHVAKKPNDLCMGLDIEIAGKPYDPRIRTFLSETRDYESLKQLNINCAVIRKHDPELKVKYQFGKGGVAGFAGDDGRIGISLDPRSPLEIVQIFRHEARHKYTMERNIRKGIGPESNPCLGVSVPVKKCIQVMQKCFDYSLDLKKDNISDDIAKYILSKKIKFIQVDPNEVPGGKEFLKALKHCIKYSKDKSKVMITPKTIEDSKEIVIYIFRNTAYFSQIQVQHLGKGNIPAEWEANLDGLFGSVELADMVFKEVCPDLYKLFEREIK